jgi:hypothetical protein
MFHNWVVNLTLEKIELACRRAASRSHSPALFELADELARMQKEFRESAEKAAQRHTCADETRSKENER